MIKRLLRDKRNFVVVDGFLSVLIGRQIKITQVLESEGNQETEDQKFNRVDLLVEDDKKEKILVEVQNDHELDFFQRMAFGASKIITDYMKIGESYGTLPKVYSINIVYFSLGQGKGYAYHGTTVFKNMFNDADELKLTPAQKAFQNDVIPLVAQKPFNHPVKPYVISHSVVIFGVELWKQR